MDNDEAKVVSHIMLLILSCILNMGIYLSLLMIFPFIFTGTSLQQVQAF